MKRAIRLRTDARLEFIKAAEWYDQQRAGLGADFIEEVERVITRIAIDTQSDELIRPGVRRALVKRFPYTVIYREEADRILVIAIFHAARDPDVWQRRL